MTKTPTVVVTNTEFFIHEYCGNESVYRRPSTDEVMSSEEFDAYRKKHNTADHFIIVI